MKNIGVLLVEFFELYGRFFQYDTVGLSLRKGGHYFEKAARGWKNPSAPALLSIEDPQDFTNDVSSGSFGLTRIRQTFSGAFEVLSAALCLRGSELLEMDRRRVNFNKKSSAEMSLLGSIMGVTQEV
jgi:non-canonical poly(A) RNA polymerase PAPD5/7